MSTGWNARELALKVLISVDNEDAYANLKLRSVLDREKPPQRDRAFISELVYGTLRSLNTLDWVLEQFLARPLHKQTPAVRNILRMGVYQIMYMDRVPDSAACNESANLARRFGNPGAVKFVNGVLRNIVRKRCALRFPDPVEKPVEYISLKYSHPGWMVRRWLKMFGFKETEDLCRANNEPAATTVRTNTLKLTREELVQIFRGEGLQVSPTEYAPEGVNLKNVFSLGELKSFKEGFFQVQDESSMLAGHALAPVPGSRVLDMASAPGGKATHLAQIMDNKGKIIACDIHPHKLDLVRDNCRRLDISIIETFAGDACDLSQHYYNWADYVLLDAPCSGLGVLRRRPDARWRKSEEQIRDLTVLQRRMLEEAERCLAPGGVLVYSTCTVTPEENIDQIRKFLSENNGLELTSLEGYLPDTLGNLDKGYVQLLPHKNRTDGFFIARMQKKRS